MASKCWVRFVKHLLATELPSVWSTQRGLACRQAREPQEKNRVSLVLLDISRCLFDIHIVIDCLLSALVTISITCITFIYSYVVVVVVASSSSLDRSN